MKQYQYYLKKCGFQELGSKNDNGKRQRGAYLLTSKSTLFFFPPLSKTQLNDNTLLPIIPLNSGEKIYCNYVYNNDKYHDSQALNPRDEYRIYLNKTIEAKTGEFVAGDIVVVRKENIMKNSNMQTIYLLDLIKPDDTLYYNKLNEIIEKSPIRGNYALYTGIFSEFEKKAENILSYPHFKVSVDETVTREIEKNSMKNVAGLFNEASFRDFVLVGYSNLCAITGNAIQYESLINLEAAHIKPKSHGGLFLPNNGIALSRDMHWAFDKGFFTLDNDLKVKVHEAIIDEYLNSYNGKQIRIPVNSFFAPDIDNIRYHQENVYGLFLKKGRL